MKKWIKLIRLKRKYNKLSDFVLYEIIRNGITNFDSFVDSLSTYKYFPDGVLIPSIDEKIIAYEKKISILEKDYSFLFREKKINKILKL